MMSGANGANWPLQAGFLSYSSFSLWCGCLRQTAGEVVRLSSSCADGSFVRSHQRWSGDAVLLKGECCRMA